MNLFIVLIPMLLLSAVFVHVTTIDMSMPSDSAEQPKPDAADLNLAVYILSDAFVVEGNRLDRRVVSRESESAWEELGAVLSTITSGHPDQRDMRIISEPHTRYEEIIHVMDVARAAGLPQVALVGTSSEG